MPARVIQSEIKDYTAKGLMADLKSMHEIDAQRAASTISIDNEPITEIHTGCRCQVLGKSTPNEGLLLTISPSPKMRVNKSNYGSLTPEEQYEVITNYLKDQIECSKCFIHKACIHYEFTKQGQIHIHAVCYIDPMDKCELQKVTFQKKLHQYFGQKQLSYKICSNVQYLDDKESAYINYVNKENIFAPTVVQRPNIRKWLDRVCYLTKPNSPPVNKEERRCMTVVSSADREEKIKEKYKYDN